MNPLIDYINNDSLYVISCNHCAKKNTDACNTCSRKRTESKPKKECHQCSEKPKKCGCDDKKESCTVKRSVCNSEHFAVQNYFSELVHDWEKDLAKYNLGISELESINYFTDLTESGELLNKVLFVFRRGHEVITKEFLVAPKGDKGDKGDCFTWESLTDALKKALKGDKGDDGDTPVLRFVRVSYSDSPCEVSGSFERFGETNMYDLLLTLPKQRTFDECLEEIRRLINLFNINFEALLATLTLRVNAIEDFDFCKLGLKLRNGNELSLTYNGLTSNPVILNLPELDEYTLRYFTNGESVWDDLLALMKNNVKEGDVLSFERFRPKDWWILTYPGAILMLNGELITKHIRVSAWQGRVDETGALANTDTKNFSMYLQTTSSYEFNSESQEYDDGTWTSLNYTYDSNSGMLTLPKNNSIATITETVDGLTTTKTVLYRYHAGDFVVAALWATDHLPRRLVIPIIDMSTYTSNNDNFLIDINPRIISDDVTYAIINYTKTWEFDLRESGIYNSDGELINCIIKVYPSTVVYKYYNGKKYFYGNYEIVTCDEEAPSPTSNTIDVSSFRLDSIFHCGPGTKKVGLKFKYLDTNDLLKELSENLYAAFYDYWKNNIELNEPFYKAVRLKQSVTNQFVDLNLCDYSSSGEVGVIYYDYSNSDIDDNIPNYAGGRRPGTSNNPYALTNYRLYVKDSYNTTNYAVYLRITFGRVSNTISFTQPYESLLYGVYTDVFNNNIMDTISDTINVNGEVSQTTNVPNGMVYANGMFFYNGLFVAESLLTGDVTVSDTGEYAYAHINDSVQIQNLTNRQITISIDDRSYTIAPNATIIEELEPVEPVNH